jgi:hypothetical protein
LGVVGAAVRGEAQSESRAQQFGEGHAVTEAEGQCRGIAVEQPRSAAAMPAPADRYPAEPPVRSLTREQPELLPADRDCRHALVMPLERLPPG